MQFTTDHVIDNVDEEIISSVGSYNSQMVLAKHS